MDQPTPETAKGVVIVDEPTRPEQVLARRAAESKATIPHLTLGAQVDGEACAAVCAGDDGPSVEHAVVRACALALREVPRANGSWRDGRIERHSRINIGLAVALGDIVVVPTLFDADRKPLEELAAEANDLAARARAGTLAAPDVGGATFTVWTTSADAMSPVVMPPQAAALAVGALATRASVSGGAVVARRTLHLTLACDHRVLSGAGAERLLATISGRIVDPAEL